MLKKFTFITLCAAIMLTLGACSSVQVSMNNTMPFTTDEKHATVGHINVDIWGIYFFGLPVFTGSFRENNKCRMFDDTVDTSHAVQMLSSFGTQKMRGNILTDVQSNRSTVWLWPTPV